MFENMVYKAINWAAWFVVSVHIGVLHLFMERL